MINSENLPSLTRISLNTISDLNIANTSSSSLSSSSIETIERGKSSKYKIAMTGATWRILKEHYQYLIPKIITRGVVFARMSSDQKQQLVQELQSLGYYVGEFIDCLIIYANEIGEFYKFLC